MRVKDIEISVDGDIGRPYRGSCPIQARVTSSAGRNEARTVKDVNSKLREITLKVGANSVVKVTDNRGIPATSWKAFTAQGVAAAAQPSARKCPFCAKP